jgi:hypothetical protein
VGVGRDVGEADVALVCGAGLLLPVQATSVAAPSAAMAVVHGLSTLEVKHGGHFP